MSPLSVIIASHNAADTLAAQLDALVQQSWPDGGEVIVADNRSVDSTAALVAAYEAAPVPVRRVAVDDAPGAAHARNVGVAHAEHDSIAFCDADDVVGHGWVAAMSSALVEHRFVGGPLEYQRLNPSWLANARGRQLDPEEVVRFDGAFPLVSSSNMGIDRALFNEVDGFDVSFLRAQDAELSHRLWSSGVRAEHRPDAVVHYRMRATNGAIFSQARSWGRQLPLLRERAGLTSERAFGQRCKNWLWLAAALPRTLTRSGRAHWMHVAGMRIGAIEGRALRARAGAV